MQALRDVPQQNWEGVANSAARWRAIGDRHLESEGKAENAEGHVRSGVGKAMDAVREIVNSEKE
jgi:hypothetical protein